MNSSNGVHGVTDTTYGRSLAIGDEVEADGRWWLVAGPTGDPAAWRLETTLGKHPQFVAWKEEASETELRATMHWPGDEERLADLNVFFVHTPQSRS